MAPWGHLGPTISTASFTTGALESLLGFEFTDPSILYQSLVHRSYCNEQDLDASASYERLEFLGDAVLELTISTELYRRFPDASEGQLTKTRSSLVRGEALATIARRLNLGDYLLVGKGVDTSGGRERDSILAAAFEALVAAVYLDQGMERAKIFIFDMMSRELAEAGRMGGPPENPKSRLQELVQGRGLPTPKYRLVASEGPDHGPVFTVEVLVEDEVVGTGQGGKKSEAETAAARAALLRLQSSD